MSSDAQALVQQLTDNPEMLESMQHMLSLLRANPPQSTQNTGKRRSSSNNSHKASSGGTSRVRPPRIGYSDDTVTANNTTTTAARFTCQHETHAGVPEGVGKEEAHAPLMESERRGRVAALSVSNRAAARRSAAAAAVTETDSSEELRTASRKLMEAQRRIAELEKELQRTTQRVDQLSEVVHTQKDELQEARDRHALELEEMRQAYDAVVRRKDEVQEEALRQLMKSRQLMLSAAKYEAVVAAKKREKENAYYASNATQDDYASGGTKQPQQQQGSATGLTASATAINARQSAHLLGSGVKRERPDDVTDNASPHPSTAYYYYSQQQQLLQQQSAVKRAASGASWGTPTSLGRTRQAQRSGEAVPSRFQMTESPEFITSSPTAATKTSTTRVNGARTQSRKRRTPRTPSLTNADRIASSQAFHYTSNVTTTTTMTTENSGSAPLSRQQLPGTASLKLDSPTPAVSAAWTAGGRSLTSSPAPPPPSAPLTSSPATFTATANKSHQQLTAAKPTLAQRAAGRLATAAAAVVAAPLREVPNTRSGTSSVVADGPTRSPSPVNPKRGNAGPRRFIFTGLRDGEPQRLAAAIAGVGDDAAVLASEMDEVPPTSTTHVVLRGTPRSVKALCGVVSAKWLVSPEYILNSQESGFWLDEMDEGGLRIFPPPLQGQRFLLTIGHEGIRARLAQVIAYGGGEVLPSNSGKVAQDVVVITSGDDLLRYATQGHM